MHMHSANVLMLKYCYGRSGTRLLYFSYCEKQRDCIILTALPYCVRVITFDVCSSATKVPVSGSVVQAAQVHVNSYVSAKSDSRCSVVV
jgi:hypothetical protein